MIEMTDEVTYINYMEYEVTCSSNPGTRHYRSEAELDRGLSMCRAENCSYTVRRRSVEVRTTETPWEYIASVQR